MFDRVFDRSCLSFVVSSTTRCVWSRFRPYLFLVGRQFDFSLRFGRVVDHSVVGRKFDYFLKCLVVWSTVVVCCYSSVRLFLMFGRVFDRSCLSLVVSWH